MNANQLIRTQQEILYRIDQMLNQTKLMDLRTRGNLTLWKQRLIWLLPPGHTYVDRFRTN